MIPNPKILIAVITCHKFKGRADKQRQTWVPILRDLPEEKRMDIKFFLGTAPGGSTREPDEDEVFLTVPDDYDSLPFKVRAAAKWAVDHGYEIILKCDDDVYILPDRLIFALPMTQYEGRINNSQHRIAPTGWCSGFAYWLVGDALKIIASHTGEPESKYEDLWVGMTLSKHGIRCKVQHNFLVLLGLPSREWINYKNNIVIGLAGENDVEAMHKVFRGPDTGNPIENRILPATGNRGSQGRVTMIRRRGKWLG